MLNGLQPLEYDQSYCYRTIEYLNRPDQECDNEMCHLGGVCEC